MRYNRYITAIGIIALIDAVYNVLFLNTLSLTPMLIILLCLIYSLGDTSGQISIKSENEKEKLFKVQR